MNSRSTTEPTANQRRSNANCMVGGGATGALMRSLHWRTTPLGDVEQWPQSLCTAISICLNSRYPMLIWWGADLLMLYNDAYRPILGHTKHPRAMGQRGKECWPEIWHIIGPMLESVFYQGEATWSEDQLLLLERNGYPEECYFTFSYSPIRDETGGIGGIFTAVTETTARVLSERRLRTLRELSERTGKAQTATEACAFAASTLANQPTDLPFTLIYLLDETAQQAQLAGATGLAPGTPASPVTIELPLAEGTVWPFAQVARDKPYEQVTGLTTRFANLPTSVWDEAPNTALVLPVAAPNGEQPVAFFIAAISPRRTLDDDYMGFLTMIAGHIATAIANARAYEEARKRAEALAELDRAKTAFFSNVSHEFRTPLTLMLGPLEELLEREQALPADIHTRIEVAHRNGLRLLKLVNILLDFSRLEAGRAQVRYTPVALATYTAEIASQFHSAIEKAGLHFLIDCPPLPELIYVDREMWEKIVLNLLSNAFKFTFAGEIVLTQFWHGDHVALTVRDTGVGIPAAELPNLFKRFHRVRGARARTYEGSGIGLALVHELVTLHGGRIYVTSSEGQGTTFTVELPTGSAHLPAERIDTNRQNAGLEKSAQAGAIAYVEEAVHWLPEETETPRPPLEQQGQQATALSIATPASRPARLLIADDNADMRQYLVRLLTPQYSVETVNDGQMALARALAQPPDLLLTDIMMPGVDGFELVTALRSDPRTRLTPIIMLSARADQDARVEGLEALADDYLIKPFSARELLARVRAHLELRQVRQEVEEQLRQFKRTLEEQVAERTHELAKRNQELDQFAYVASHDLKAPLRSIEQLANWISQDTSDVLPNSAKAHLDKLLGRVKRMEKLLDDLLAYSRAGRAQHTPERVDTAALIAEVIRLIAPPANFVILVQEPMPVLATKRVPLELVLRNLITNAIKHHHQSHGQIQISAADKGPVIEFTVADDGPGIAPQFHARVFQMFQTLKPRDQVEGSGMGLAFVKRMVENQGGQIWLDSNEGQGAIFRFTWPKEQAPAAVIDD